MESLQQAGVESGAIGPLPDGKALRVASLGFERLIADLYWIRTVFYVGSEAAEEANFPSAEGLAHLVTDIDPAFDSAYVLMSSVLGGLRYDPDAAIRLLEKGIEHSDYWRIYFLLGFYSFMEKSDYAKGALYLSEASDRGGPDYLPLLAARLYAQSGRLDAGISFLQARLRQAQHPRIVRDIKRRLRELLTERDLLQIDAAAQRYEASFGRAPERLDQLREAGLLGRLSADPSGASYQLREGRAQTQGKRESLRVKN